MAVVNWQGVSQGQSAATPSYTGTGNPENPSFSPSAGSAGVNPKDYPFTDPVYQNFTVQQYLTVSGVSQPLYSEKAPEVEEPARKASK